MKKIFSLCILILTLCLGSTVFGAKIWSEVEFEKFINLVGYGEIDLDNFTFSTSNYSKSKFINYLTGDSYGMVILKGNNDNRDGFDSSRFYVYFLQPSASTQLFVRSSRYNLGSISRFY